MNLGIIQTGTKFRALRVRVLRFCKISALWKEFSCDLFWEIVFKLLYLPARKWSTAKKKNFFELMLWWKQKSQIYHDLSRPNQRWVQVKQRSGTKANRANIFIKQPTRCSDLIRQITVYILFTPSVVATPSLDALDVYRWWNQGLTGIIPLCSIWLWPRYPVTAWLWFPPPVLWLSLLSCYTPIYCVIGECAPPPETPVNLRKNKRRVKAGDEIVSPQNQLTEK